MQTLITVGIIVLVFALITVLLIPLMKKMTQSAQLEYELNLDGVTVQVLISSGYEDVSYPCSGEQTLFMLKYAYFYGAVSYEREESVPESDYQTFHEGAEVRVKCLARHPKTARLLIAGRPDIL